MRLAFVTSQLPTGDPDTGFEIASACVIGALKEAGCNVTQFGFRRDEQAPPADTVPLGTLPIAPAEASALQKAAWLRESLRRRLPTVAAKLAQAGEGALRKALLDAGPFDAIVLNGAPIAAAFPWLMDEQRSILIAHQVEHRAAGEAAAGAGLLGRFLIRRDATLLHAAEHAALQRARFVWCFSEGDRSGFEIDISGRSAALPLLAPAPARRPKAAPTVDIGLIGTWTGASNLAGLRWFLGEVAPRLPQDHAIAIAGRVPSGFACRDPRVALLGRVPDAAAFVASTRTIALTGRTETGAQLKSIEAFQFGKPSVATPASVRNFRRLPTNCLVADDAASFAAALVKLVADVRSERSGPGDGRAFVAAQRKGMREAIRRGLDAVGADTPR